MSSPLAGQLIDGTFPNSGAAAIDCDAAPGITSTIGEYLPTARIGHGNFVYVYEDYGSNWYGLSAVTRVNTLGQLISHADIAVIQAYNIDKKIDEGLPLTGNVQALYLSGGLQTSDESWSPNTTTAGGDATSCYDTTTSTYSVTVSGGANTNCALSFKFQ